MAKPSLSIDLQLFADKDPGKTEPEEDFNDDDFEKDDLTDDEDDKDVDGDEDEDGDKAKAKPAKAEDSKQKPVDGDKEEYLDLDDLPVFNKEPRKVKKAEAKDLLQKGMNYDKVHGKLAETEKVVQEISELTGMDINTVLNDLRNQKNEAEAAAYAKTHGVTKEEADRELRIKRLEERDTFRDGLRRFEDEARKEKKELEEKPFFKELEPEIDALIEENKKQGRFIYPKTAYNYLRGERLEELMEKTKTDTVKSTTANIHDRAKRGPIAPDGKQGEDIDVSGVDSEMARAFGNDPKKIARYVSRQTKKK